MKKLWHRITGPSAEEIAAAAAARSAHASANVSTSPTPTISPSTSLNSLSAAAQQGNNSNAASSSSAATAASTSNSSLTASTSSSLTVPTSASRGTSPPRSPTLTAARTTNISSGSSGGGLPFLQEDDDIESELERFEGQMRLMNIEGAQPMTLLQTVEAMCASEIVASAAPAAAGVSDSTTLTTAESNTTSPPKSSILRHLCNRLRRNLLTRSTLGAMNLLTELLTTYRDAFVGVPPASNSNSTSPPTPPLDPTEFASLHTVLLDLFRLLTPYTTDSHPFHCYFNLFLAPHWSSSLLTTLRSVTSSSVPSLPYVVFDPSPSTATTKGSWMYIPNISCSRWISAHQYSCMTWIRMDVRVRKPQLPPRGNEASTTASVSSSTRPRHSFATSHKERTSYAHTPFTLFSLDSDDGKTSVSLTYSPAINTFTLRTSKSTSSSSSTTFTPATPLNTSKWYHIVLTHSKSLIGASTAILYLNGESVSTQKCSFPGKPASASTVTAKIGIQPIASLTQGEAAILPPNLPLPPPSSLLQWRVSSCAFLDDSTNEATARSLYDAGPRMSGVAAGATLLTARCSLTDTCSSSYQRSNALNEALDDVTDIVARTVLAQQRARDAQTPTGTSGTPLTSPSSSRTSPRTPSSTNMFFSSSADEEDDDSIVGSLSHHTNPLEVSSILPTSYLSYEKLLFFYSAKNSIDKEVHEFTGGSSAKEKERVRRISVTQEAAHRRGSSALVNTSSSSSSLSSSSSPSSSRASLSSLYPTSSILINGGLLGLKDGSSDAFCLEGVHLIKPQSFVDTVRMIGGVQRILELFAIVCLEPGKCDSTILGLQSNTNALREILLILSNCLRRNPKNYTEILTQKGYTIIAHLLQRFGECYDMEGGEGNAAGGMSSFSSAASSKINSPEKVVRTTNQSTLKKQQLQQQSTLSSTLPSPTTLYNILTDTSLIEILFSLTGLSDKGTTGFISCQSAFSSLLLNFHIWSHFALGLQVYLFEGLVNCIAINPSREENMLALRNMKLVPWLLTLVADQKLPNVILVHAVSLLREFLMDPPTTMNSSSNSNNTAAASGEEELQLVANFALTACMLHSQHEIHHQQQQSSSYSSSASHHTHSQSEYPPSHSSDSRARGPSVRRFTIANDTRPVLSSHSTSGVNVQAGLSALGVATGYLPTSAEVGFDTFDRELSAYRLGSFLSSRVRRNFLELLLDVGLKLHTVHPPSSTHPSDLKAIESFFIRVDFAWIFSVLYTVDQAITYRRKRCVEEMDEANSSENTTSILTFDEETDEEIVCDRTCGLLVLKLLLIYLSHPSLYKKFLAIHGFTSLTQLLLPYAHLSEVYAIIVCMMLGKGVYDIPTIPTLSSIQQRGGSAQTQNAAQNAQDWWTSFLPSGTNNNTTSTTGSRSSTSSSSTSPSHSHSNNSNPSNSPTSNLPISLPIPEALPVLMALLEESMHALADEHRGKIATAWSQNETASAATSNPPVAPPSAALTSAASLSNTSSAFHVPFTTSVSASPAVSRRPSISLAGGLNTTGGGLNTSNSGSSAAGLNASLSVNQNVAGQSRRTSVMHAVGSTGSTAASTLSMPTGSSGTASTSGSRRPSFIMSGASAVTSTGAHHHRTLGGSLSLQPMLAAMASRSAAPLGLSFATASSSQEEEEPRHSRQHSLGGNASSTPPVAQSLDRAYWTYSRTPTLTNTTSGIRRRLNRVGCELPHTIDPTLLQQLLAFLCYLHASSEEFRTLASKEPFIRSVAACTHAAAPLQPESLTTGGSNEATIQLPGASLVDIHAFTAFAPVLSLAASSQQQQQTIDPGQLIISPIYTAHTVTRANSGTAGSAGNSTANLPSTRHRKTKSISLVPGGFAGLASLAQSAGASPILRSSPSDEERRKSESKSATTSRPETPTTGIGGPMSVTIQEFEFSSSSTGAAAQLDDLPNASTSAAASSSSAPPAKLEVFQHPLATTLFHLLRQISLHSLFTSHTGALTSGSSSTSSSASSSSKQPSATGGVAVLTNVLDDLILEQIPYLDGESGGSNATNTSTSAQPSSETSSLSTTSNNNSTILRSKYQNILMSSLIYKLLHTLSASEFLSSIRLLHNIVSLSRSILAKLQSNYMIGTLWLEFIMSLLETPEGRALMEMECVHQDPHSLLNSTGGSGGSSGGSGGGNSGGGMHHPTSSSSTPSSIKQQRRTSTTITGTTAFGGMSNSAALAAIFNFSTPISRSLIESCNSVLLHLYQQHISQLSSMMIVQPPTASPTSATTPSTSSAAFLFNNGNNGSGGNSNTNTPVSCYLSPSSFLTPQQYSSLNSLHRLNTFLLVHSRTLLGEYQTDQVFLASMCWFLVMLITPTTQQSEMTMSGGLSSGSSSLSGMHPILSTLSLSSMSVFRYLLRHKLGYMTELLRVTSAQNVNVVTGAIMNESLPVGGGGVNNLSVTTPSSAHTHSSSTGGGIGIFSHSSSLSHINTSSTPLTSPRSVQVNVLSDLFDNGFDQLLHSSTESINTTGGSSLASSDPSSASSLSSSPEFQEFLLWRSAHTDQISYVFSKTAGKIYAYWSGETRKLGQTTASHATQIQSSEITKHLGFLIAISNRLPQLEYVLLHKLQLTCSEELQRNLRKQQRERVDQCKLDREYYEKESEKWLRRNMMYSVVDYTKEDIVSTIASLPSNTYQEFPLSTTLILRQPWRFDRIEGPARIRKRLDAMVIQRKDEPVFTYPYRPFENEKSTMNSAAKEAVTTTTQSNTTEREEESTTPPPPSTDADIEGDDDRAAHPHARFDIVLSPSASPPRSNASSTTHTRATTPERTITMLDTVAENEAGHGSMSTLSTPMTVTVSLATPPLSPNPSSDQTQLTSQGPLIRIDPMAAPRSRSESMEFGAESYVTPVNLSPRESANTSGSGMMVVQSSRHPHTHAGHHHHHHSSQGHHNRPSGSVSARVSEPGGGGLWSRTQSLVATSSTPAATALVQVASQFASGSGTPALNESSHHRSHHQHSGGSHRSTHSDVSSLFRSRSDISAMFSPTGATTPMNRSARSKRGGAHGQQHGAHAVSHLLSAAATGGIGFGLVSASPLTSGSMLGRLTSDTGRASKRHSMRQIAGASFTPRLSLSVRNSSVNASPFATMSASPPGHTRMLSPGGASASATPPDTSASSVASQLAAASPSPVLAAPSGLRRALMQQQQQQQSTRATSSGSDEVVAPPAGIVFLSPMSPTPALDDDDGEGRASSGGTSATGGGLGFNWVDDAAAVSEDTAKALALSAAPSLEYRSTASAVDEGNEDITDLDASGVGVNDDSLTSDVAEDWADATSAAAQTAAASILDTQLWWMEEERLSMLLDNETIRYHFNCLRIDGLDEIRGILLLCNHAIFLIDNYEISPEGDITPVLSEAELERIEMSQHYSQNPNHHHHHHHNLNDSTVSASTFATEVSPPTQPLEHHSEKFNYSDLIDIQKRRYLLREAAIELFFVNGCNILLVLNIAQRDTIYNQILSHAHQMIKNQGNNTISKLLAAAGASVASSVSSSTSSSSAISQSASSSFLHNSVPHTKSHTAEFQTDIRTLLHPLTKLWQNGLLSNYDYLISLNTISGRTFNDLTQYPVLPWIICDYDSAEMDFDNHSSFRDLTKPMGALDEHRAQQFRQRYRDSEAMMSLNSQDPYSNVTGGSTSQQEAAAAKSMRFHYGSHYSSAAAVLYYMIRTEPFTQTLIKFQSGRFDRPDRLFNSISSTYRSASALSTSDVKELIPEFFSVPEFLQNGNKLNLGARQDDEAHPIDDVILPRWAHGSSREYIRIHRRALESEYVSAHLHSWIDLIFGIKQSGEAAVHALNVFYYLTYAGGVDIDSIQDPILRRATCEQVRSFGQTPLSLFSKPHPPKHLMPEIGALYIKSHLLRPSISLHFSHPVGCIWSDATNERFFLTRPGHALMPAEGLSTVLGGASSSHAILSRTKQLKRSSKAGFLAYGFMDGTLRVGEAMAINVLSTQANSSSSASSSLATQVSSSSAKHTRVYLNMHDGIIRTAAFPEIDVGLFVTGGIDTNVRVWKRSESAVDSEFTLLATLHGHRAAVTCVAVSKSFSLIASGSNDSTVILWDLYSHSSLRQLRFLPTGSKIQGISINNKSGYVVITSNNPTMITVCDINGVKVAQFPHATSASISPPTVPMKRAQETMSGTSSPTVKPDETNTTATSFTAPSSPNPASSTTTTPDILDSISCLHMVDTVGYQMSSSLILFLTGHAGGGIKVWNMNYVAPYNNNGVGGLTSPRAGGGRTRQGSFSSATRPKHTSTTPTNASKPSAASSPRNTNNMRTPASPSNSGAGGASASSASKRTLQSYLSTTIETDEIDENSVFSPDAALVSAVPSSTTGGDAGASTTTTSSGLVSPAGEQEMEAIADTTWDAEDEADAAEMMREENATAAAEDEGLPSSATASGKLTMKKTQSMNTPSSTSTNPIATSGAVTATTPTSGNAKSVSRATSLPSPLVVSSNDDSSVPSPTSSALSPTSQLRGGSNTTGGREWRIQLAADLIGHVAPVTALFVSQDRHSLWSGDAQGNAIHWTLPPESSGVSSTPSSSTSSSNRVSSPFAITHSVPQVASTVACNCKQSVQHKSSNVPYNCRLCPQCTNVWVCSYCRLDHLRKEHSSGRKPHSGRAAAHQHPTGAMSISRPTTPKDEPLLPGASSL